jgi:hypothetical protein
MNMTTSAVCDSTMEERLAALEAWRASVEKGMAKAPKVVKEKKSKEKSVLALSPSDDMGRMNAADIDDDLCQARICNDEDVIPGYAPKVFRETQCKRSKKVGDLCTICNKAWEKAAALGDDYQCYKKDHGKWYGLITEEPHPTCHMLGTEWALKKVSKTDADDATSESGSSEKMTKASKAEEKAAKAAAKAAEKAEKAAAKEAEKAEKAAVKAAKEAAKEKPKAVKAVKAKPVKEEAEEAESESESDASEAEAEVEEVKPVPVKAKEVKEKAKPAVKEKGKEKVAAKEKPKAKAATKAKAKADVMPAKAVAEEVKETYEHVDWDGDVLLKKSNGDCYAADELTCSLPTTYVGHMTEEGVLDKNIPEQKEAESDTE